MDSMPCHISWGDWMTEEDNKRRDHFLNISDAEWKTVVERHLAAHKANPGPALAWVERIQRIRVARAESRAMDILLRGKKTQLDITFNVWKDMIEEPWRYGDNDWAEWLEMDHELRNSPKRWRVDAFWQKKQDEADEVSRKAFIQMLVNAKTAFDNRMATRIQAVWRGHQERLRMLVASQEEQDRILEESLRSFTQLLVNAKTAVENRMATRIQSAWRGHNLRNTHPKLNCSRCLSHKPAQYKCTGGVYACEQCVVESFNWDEEESPRACYCHY